MSLSWSSLARVAAATASVRVRSLLCVLATTASIAALSTRNSSPSAAVSLSASAPPAAAAAAAAAATATACGKMAGGRVFDFVVKDHTGSDYALKQYEGKVLIIVNTASKCGLTPQFKGLEALYQAFKDKGLVIIGFPCRQFAMQEFKDQKEVMEFCQLNYGVTFPMMERIDVNGDDTDPLFTYIKDQKRATLGLKRVMWNFTKFIVDQNGKVVARISPQLPPEKLYQTIADLLGVPVPVLSEESKAVAARADDAAAAAAAAGGADAPEAEAVAAEEKAVQEAATTSAAAEKE